MTVSVIIPHYNSTETLSRALKSVASQTVNALETIVVDDASTQTSVAELEAIASQFSNTRIVPTTVNSGPSAARNKGWDLALGDWVAFLDADDIWHPQKIQHQLSVLIDNPDVRTIGGGHVVTDSVEKFNATEIDCDFKRVPKQEFLVRNPLATSSVLTARDTTRRFPADQRYAEDFALWLLLKNDSAVAVLLSPCTATFKWFYGEGGLSSHMFRMIRGEYKTFWRAKGQKAIGSVEFLLACTVLTIRVVRRLALAFTRKLRKSLVR